MGPETFCLPQAHHLPGRTWQTLTFEAGNLISTGTPSLRRDVDCQSQGARAENSSTLRAQMARMSSSQKHESVTAGHDRQIPLVQEFTWHLLNELVDVGLHQLTRTLWDFAQPLGKDPMLKFNSVAGPPPCQRAI